MGRRLEQLEEFGIDVVLERRHGVRATVLRGVLYALSFVYDSVVQLRLYFYRKRVFRERALGCLVISIGNLTVGGTGKTPIVEKFARALQAGGRRVAILSRGYKSVPRRRDWRSRFRGDSEPPRIVSDGKSLLLDSAIQAAVIGQFHDEVGPAFIFIEGIDMDDVGMVERRPCPGFAVEAIHYLFVISHFLFHELHGDFAREVHIEGAVNNAHAA
jgi:hypothetical protein